jgi:hypothetical protein
MTKEALDSTQAEVEIFRTLEKTKSAIFKKMHEWMKQEVEKMRTDLPPQLKPFAGNIEHAMVEFVLKRVEKEFHVT